MTWKMIRTSSQKEMRAMIDTEVIARVASIIVHEIKCDIGCYPRCPDTCPAFTSDGKCLVAIVCDHLVELYKRNHDTG